jgi:hypothetical protein
MKRYAIWNKKDPILTPIGEVLTAEQWIERYPIAGVETITVVCAYGEINGAFFGTLGQMVMMYEQQGADFSACTTNEEKLEVIESFEDQRNAVQNTGISNEELTATSLASIASSLEYQNMLTLDDVEE